MEYIIPKENCPTLKTSNVITEMLKANVFAVGSDVECILNIMHLPVASRALLSHPYMATKNHQQWAGLLNLDSLMLRIRDSVALPAGICG